MAPPPSVVPMRQFAIIVPAALLCGCACGGARPAVQGPVRVPAALMIAFSDDFHSGVIVSRRDVPAWILPGLGRAAPDSPWVVLHFGEKRWIRGEADGILDAMRLAVLPGDGGVQVDLVPWWMHDRGGTVIERVRLWVFPLDAAQRAAFLARLDGWIDPSAGPERLAVDTCWWPARRSWTLATNCHDFTIDLLESAGVAVPWRPVHVASGLHDALDQALLVRDALW